MKPEKLLPGEHGLTVSWITVILISLFTANDFFITGLILLLLNIMILPGMDRILYVLKAIFYKRSIHNLFKKKIDYYVFSIVVIGAVTLLIGIRNNAIPLVSVIIPTIFFFIFLKFFMSRGYRNSYTMRSAIIFVGSIYIIINSSLTKSFNHKEILIFILIMFLEIILVNNVEMIKKQNIAVEWSKEFNIAIFCLLIIMTTTLYMFMGNITYMILFFIFYLSTFFIYFLIKNRSIRITGIVSTIFNIFFIAIITVLYSPLLK
ncbi:MAG: hypothetical protein M1481_07370 [Candidatus Thermoplasmatota archaeon]|nr:hypothetical protein [Candidatus Thermoplasmatota archaeon]MCL5963425.1 hypothetical protein [Candidatus Thermoplasmatota archaeon]